MLLKVGRSSDLWRLALIVNLIHPRLTWDESPSDGASGFDWPVGLSIKVILNELIWEYSVNSVSTVP